MKPTLDLPEHKRAVHWGLTKDTIFAKITSTSWWFWLKKRLCYAKAPLAPERWEPTAKWREVKQGGWVAKDICYSRGDRTWETPAD